MSNHQEYLKDMLDRRVQTIKDRADLAYSLHVKRVKRDNADAIANREFMKKHAVGRGVDICCGDFVTEGAIGVDPQVVMVGTDYLLSDGDLSFSKANELDYVVTNYIEAIPNTIKALNEWHRCLKVGGTLAIVVMDADGYKNREGALRNRKRFNTFTKVTIAHYLSRAGFTDIEVVQTGLVLHVTARKAK